VEALEKDIQPVLARAEHFLVNRQYSSNRRMEEDLEEDLEVTSSLSMVEDTQAVLARAERLPRPHSKIQRCKV
jgi:hypothetical protein